MNRKQMLERLNELGFDKADYWLVAGSAMVLYGLRAETGDIDMGCAPRLSEKLQAQGCPVDYMPDGTKHIVLAEDVELFENWLYDRVEAVDGIPAISLQGLIEMKKRIGREKDLRDIALIEQYLKG